MRVLSPKIEPPEMLEDGSTANTATRCPWAMKVSAIENPIPRFPPVMRTVRAVVMSTSVTVRRKIAGVDRETQSLTSLPAAPAEERASRMVAYSISMALRLVCLFLCLVVPGWWVLIPAVGVIVLPIVGGLVRVLLLVTVPDLPLSVLPRPRAVGAGHSPPSL